MVSGRLQLAGTRAFDNGRGEMGLRGGINVRHHGSDSVDINFNGSPLRFDRPGDDTVFGGYVGANITYAVNDRFSLLADVEYGQASGDERSILGDLGFNVYF